MPKTAKRKEIITRQLGPTTDAMPDGIFRMRVAKCGANLVSIHNERYNDDPYGWEGSTIWVHKDEIKAAAKLLGITNTLF